MHALSLLVWRRKLWILSVESFFWGGACRRPPVGDILQNCAVCCFLRKSWWHLLGKTAIHQQALLRGETALLLLYASWSCCFFTSSTVHWIIAIAVRFPLCYMLCYVNSLLRHQPTFFNLSCCLLPLKSLFFCSTLPVSEAHRVPSLGRKNNVCSLLSFCVWSK